VRELGLTALYWIFEVGLGLGSALTACETWVRVSNLPRLGLGSAIRVRVTLDRLRLGLATLCWIFGIELGLGLAYRA
jgi:hypothetical protein